MNTFELRMRGQAQPADFLLQVAHTAELDTSVLTQCRQLLDVVFDGEFGIEDWDHSIGGMHAIAWHRTSVIGHASVVQRRLVHNGRALRTGYVEGVGVDPAWQRQGIGGQMMEALERLIKVAYDLGALSASDNAVSMYQQRRWIRWLGPTSALTPAGIVRTADEDGGVYVLPVAEILDVTGELTCDWRDGDQW